MDQIPAVGNVLGFSLLLRDRRALLRLDHRVLAPGLTLRDYEAEIPGIRFPLKAPLSAGAFRHRRCRVCRATFELDQHALTSWLERQLVGLTIAGTEIIAARIELCSRADPEGEPIPALHVRGRRPGGEQIDLLVALTLRPEHHRIRLRPIRTWLIGTVQVEADTVWQAVARSLGESEAGDLVVDPGWQLLMPALVAAGWKAPDTSSLKVTGLELSEERLEIALSSSGPTTEAVRGVGVDVSPIDPVADRLQRVREAMGEHRLQDAVATLTSTAELLAHHAPARCALLRWVAALTRHAKAKLAGAEELCLEALTQWLRTAPNDPQARRWLVELLARGDRRDELTRLSMAARELTRSPRARARFDLALGWLLSARPRDRAAARALLAPWIERADDDRQLADLRVPLRLAMAHARLDDPKRATATLERALEEISDASVRADARVELAAALIESDQPAEALPLLRSALRDDPQHPKLAAVAGEMAQRLGAEPTTTLSPEPPPATTGKRELLLERAASGDVEALPEIEALLDEAADDTDLRQAAASLARELGQPDRLARHLLRLRELADEPRAQTQLRWERTRALIAAGQPQAVWAELAPALEHLADVQNRQGLAWAIEYAPSSEVAPHLQRLLESSSATEAIEVLRTRWQRWGAPDCGAEALVELLQAQGQIEECRRLCRALADRTQDRQRVGWLVQAAEHAPPELAADWLEEALAEAPGDRSLEARLEAALQAAGQTHRLADLWRQRSEDDRRDLDERIEALDRRIALRHRGRNDGGQTSDVDGAGRSRSVDRELLELYRARIALRDDHLEARLALAAQAKEQGDKDEAEVSMQRALHLMEADDPRALEPALWLARQSLDASDGAAAARWLQRVESLGQQSHAIASMLLETGQLLGDDEMVLRSLCGMLEATPDPTERAGLHLRLARLRQAMGDLPGAASEAAAASRYVDQGSPRHLEIAEVWLELARDRRMPPPDEARARAELRRALGDDLASSEIRHEALLLANALDEPTQAIDLVEQVLARRPSDQLLLSTLKEVCAARGEERRYLDALIRAIEHMPPQQRRDALILELASGAVDLDEPQLALSTLDRLTTVGATSPEALDLRDWAVHQLGREDDELRSIDDKLAVAPDDAAALARLSRLEPSDAASAEHLVGLATRTPRVVASALVREALQRALRAQADTVATRALRRALELSAPGQVLDPDLDAAWDRLVDRALQTGDETMLAELLGAMADFGGAAAKNRAQAGLDRALAAGLHGPHCMRVLWAWAVAEAADDPVATAGGRIDGAHGQRSVDWARQLASLAEQLDRRQAGALLRERAASSLDDPETSPILLSALQETGHLADVVRLLERGLGALEPTELVATCKRLAHLYADHLGDPQRAEQLLEQALTHEPDDPDLLLPLLERYFERDDLGRAVELSVRVLEHVPMGDTAYLALAHRAADAALAQGLQNEASDLLGRALDRAPEDRRTLERVAELEAIQGDPEHRVRLLAMVADRQGGRSRLEALEEQARLLVDPLGRHEQAIAVLEVLRREDPGREPCNQILRRLYAGTGRWRDLASLLEDEIARQHGVERCRTLRELAMVYRDRLLDLPRAEQALRVALDHLGEGESDDDRDLAEQMRRELVGDLEAQGRYVDLSIYLERALASEIEGQSGPDQVHPIRIELLVELARIYRGPLDDEHKAGRIYERLERLNRLPDEGLATLARTYHRSGRHEDLVRILAVRAKALAEAGEPRRKATVDQRIAELLEGPLGRPHEAAAYYLDAYLAAPSENTSAGARARVLLSGTQPVVVVRQQLIERLERLDDAIKPAALTLLGDILGPHEDHEEEAEARYRQALEIDPRHPHAREALGRLLARQGRLQDAVDPLVEAAAHPAIEPQRAAENAAIAARALLELGAIERAEEALKQALHRAPDSQRALLELARLYEKTHRPTEQAIVLENLSQLPLSSMLGAEVAYRRAMLLMATAREDAYSPEAERARAYLLEAVSADNKHAAARQVLLELAQSRLEWSIVAHMHYLSIRELQPGPQRALVHLDLAETYLDHLQDGESSARNLESALLMAPEDLVVVSRAGKIASRLPSPRRVAERFERLASRPGELDDSARARLWLLAADLRMSDDDPVAAEAASQRVLDLQSAPRDAAAAARRNLELLADDEARDLRQQKSGLLRLLESEDQAVERVHILSRLREIGQSLGDDDLVEWTSKEQIELAGHIDTSEHDYDAASAALREVFAERGSYEEIVELYQQLAARSQDPARRADALVEAARFSWHGLRAPEKAFSLLREALEAVREQPGALALMSEISRASEDPGFKETAYNELQKIDARLRPMSMSLDLAELARAMGKSREAVAILRPLCIQTRDDEVRYRALRELDSILSRVSTPADRLPILRRYFEDAIDRTAEELPRIAYDLARCELDLDHVEGALATCKTGLEYEPDNQDLLRLYIDLLEREEQWDPLAEALEQLALGLGDPAAQVQMLVRGARVRLDHQSTAEAAQVRGRALSEARRLLIRACETGADHPLPRAVLLPVSFSERRWDEVLELASELRERGGDDHDVLILAALTEAYRLGRRNMARDLGFRHDPTAHQNFLYPGLRQLLTEVAARGPLPRLDSLLAAGSALCGGRLRLSEGLRAWAAGRPVQAGLALGLARLGEAEGDAALARNLYQIAAFMAPDGPVPTLVARLPLPDPPSNLDPAEGGPMQGRSSLRALLAQLGARVVDMTGRSVVAAVPPTESGRARMALAESILEPWRRTLQLPLPLAWSNRSMTGGVSVENRVEPTILIGPGVGVSSLPELRFRLAYAVASIATGLSIVDSGATNLEDLLDAIRQLLDPAHQPSNPNAQALADVMASAAPAITASERNTLLAELDHWLGDPTGREKLRVELRRARLLFAARLSGQLDGALLALAHDHGFVGRGRPDPVATLRTEDAHWLLRGLGLY